jgi:hypothetical protein
MPSPTLSYEELEAFHDVLEAARCFWYDQPAFHSRAAETLRLANRLFWRLGEQLPKTGTPSERFLPVRHSTSGNQVEKILDFVLDLTREYANKYDPWCADTVFFPTSLASKLSRNELEELREALGRLGLTLELNTDDSSDQIIIARQNLGPWGENNGEGDL